MVAFEPVKCFCFRKKSVCEGWILFLKTICVIYDVTMCIIVLCSKVQYSCLSFIMVTFLQADAVFFKDWILNLKLQEYLNSLVWTTETTLCQNMQCVLQRCNIPLKEAQLALMFESSPISLKNVTLLSKKPICHLFGRNTICLKERFYSPKIKLNQLPLLKVTPWFDNM